MNSSISSNSWSKETESRLIHDDFGGDRQRWEDVHAALLEIERQGRALNIAAVELEVARGALAKTQAERDRARLDLREAVRGGAVLARERNEAARQRDIVRETVERLTWVIKGAHGALTDAGTVVVPGVLDGDLGPAIRQLTQERDEARAERDTAAENYLLMVDNVEKLHAEVDRLRELVEGSVGWRTAQEQKARAERAEAGLAEWRKHDSAPDCVACAALDAALAEGEVLHG